MEYSKNIMQIALKSRCTCTRGVLYKLIELNVFVSSFPWSSSEVQNSKMFNSRAFAIMVVVAMTASAVTCCRVESEYYEERCSYRRNPECRPSRLDTGLKCKDIGAPVQIQGGLVSVGRIINFRPFLFFDAIFVLLFQSIATGNFILCHLLQPIMWHGSLTPWAFKIVVQPTRLSSNHWTFKHPGVERMALLLLVRNGKFCWLDCSGLLKVLSIIWIFWLSDSVCGYQRLTRRICEFPTAQYPFLCAGADGTPGTYGKRLESMLKICFSFKAKFLKKKYSSIISCSSIVQQYSAGRQPKMGSIRSLLESQDPRKSRCQRYCYLIQCFQLGSRIHTRRQTTRYRWIKQTWIQYGSIEPHRIRLFDNAMLIQWISARRRLKT